MAKSRIRLRGIGPGLDGKVWESDDSLCIGRAPGVEVSVPDTGLSRHHAEVILSDDGWVVRDLGSTNGTFVNGLRVGQEGCKLNPGDLLQAGDVVLMVAAVGEPTP